MCARTYRALRRLLAPWSPSSTAGRGLPHTAPSCTPSASPPHHAEPAAGDAAHQSHLYTVVLLGRSVRAIALVEVVLTLVEPSSVISACVYVELPRWCVCVCVLSYTGSHSSKGLPACWSGHPPHSCFRSASTNKRASQSNCFESREYPVSGSYKHLGRNKRHFPVRAQQVRYKLLLAG